MQVDTPRLQRSRRRSRSPESTPESSASASPSVRLVSFNGSGSNEDSGSFADALQADHDILGPAAPLPAPMPVKVKRWLMRRIELNPLAHRRASMLWLSEKPTEATAGAPSCLSSSRIVEQEASTTASECALDDDSASTTSSALDADSAEKQARAASQGWLDEQISTSEHDAIFGGGARSPEVRERNMAKLAKMKMRQRQRQAASDTRQSVGGSH